ncbi:hypothetical protein NMYAN_320009 [Nitrosomonas nitrosa]|uniref:Uncharacterized protein n=1 Tax=Nitrosomonas nitrosa TaxID=52442 RepID=A0A8H8Z1X1_9PROT|nr:hypothetical protein NMYAN_320009 [Nitrosomonas nitrosa]
MDVIGVKNAFFNFLKDAMRHALSAHGQSVRWAL